MKYKKQTHIDSDEDAEDEDIDNEEHQRKETILKNP